MPNALGLDGQTCEDNNEYTRRLIRSKEKRKNRYELPIPPFIQRCPNARLVRLENRKSNSDALLLRLRYKLDEMTARIAPALKE
jgi:hypothetical protein